MKAKLMRLSDLAFTKHLNRVYGEKLVVPPKGSWKSRRERDEARHKLIDSLTRTRR